MRIFKEFRFDAAHHLPHAFPAGHPNHRLHGHSYRVRVTLSGRPDPETMLIRELGGLGDALEEAKATLDHRYLNQDVPGLEKPSLEALALWLWRFLAPSTPELAEIGVYRDGDGEGCVYAGELEKTAP